MTDLKKSIDENLANLWLGGFASRSTMIDLLTGSKDRIEKLEAALREIIERAEYRMSHSVSDDICLIARKALEGKDE
jgi:protein-arginine kinase activator protein McsA